MINVIETVDINLLEPNDYNPNEMQDSLFNELVTDIQEEEVMDQPIVVTVHPDDKDKYLIVDGEHRWRAAVAAGHIDIPISVKPWDESERMIHTMRRNLLRGETNPKKFTDMVGRLMEKENLSLVEARKRMGIYNDKTFAKMYLKKSADSKKKATELIQDAEQGMNMTALTANLSQVVRDLMINHGDTLAQGFIYFMFKGKPILMISMDNDLQKSVAELVSVAKEDEISDAEMSMLMRQAVDKVIDSV